MSKSVIKQKYFAKLFPFRPAPSFFPHSRMLRPDCGGFPTLSLLFLRNLKKFAGRVVRQNPVFFPNPAISAKVKALSLAEIAVAPAVHRIPAVVVKVSALPAGTILAHSYLMTLCRPECPPLAGRSLVPTSVKMLSGSPAVSASSPRSSRSFFS